MERIQPATYDLNTTLKKLVASKLFWAIFCGFFFAYPLLKSLNRDLPESKAAIASLPAYTFTNQFGKPFGSSELKGKAYIATFSFTSCTTTCPKFWDELVKVQHRVRGLGTNVAIVTFTVDPEFDSPDVLYKKGSQLKTNPYLWFMLTSNDPGYIEFLNENFRTQIGRKSLIGNTTLYEIPHRDDLALVDTSGQIRGFYKSDKDGINRLMIDLGLLLNRELANQR